jgi:MFS family permease
MLHGAMTGMWMRLKEEVRSTAGGLPRVYWYLWWGTLVNRLGSFVVPFLALYLTRERGFTVEQAGLTASLHGGGAVLSGLVGGMVADRLGRRTALIAGLWLGSLGMLFLGFAREPLQIAVAAALLGFLGEMYRPAVAAAISDVVPAKDRARAFGLLYWVVNLGFSIAVPLAGLASRFGFQALFIADACTTFLYGVVVWWKVPETRPTFAAAPGSERRGFSVAPFVDRVFLAFALPVLLTAFIFFQSNVTLPMDLSARGISPTTFGLVLGVNGVMIVLVQPFMARVLTRVRRSVALAWASALTGLGFGLYALTPDAGLAALAVLVWTLGEIAMAPVASAVVADLAPPEERGTYQGAYSTLWAMAACTAPALGGWVLGRHGSQALWGTCLVLGVSAALWHLAIGGARRRRLETLRQTRPEVSTALE